MYLIYILITIIIIIDFAVIRILYIVRDYTAVHLSNISTYTGASNPNLLASLTSFNPASASTSSNNLLAYRPNFSGLHGSGIGAFFVNIDALFPCLNPGAPICSVFTFEEDGFRGGRALIAAADGGNNFPVFGSASQNIASFGFGFSGCSQITLSCFGVSSEYSIVCLLPRNRCA